MRIAVKSVSILYKETVLVIFVWILNSYEQVLKITLWILMLI